MGRLRVTTAAGNGAPELEPMLRRIFGFRIPGRRPAATIPRKIHQENGCRNCVTFLRICFLLPPASGRLAPRYPLPIVDHAVAREKTLAIFARQKGG